MNANDPQTITFSKDYLTQWLARYFEARCEEHGSEDQEWNVVGEMVDMISRAVNDPVNDHEDHW